MAGGTGGVNCGRAVLEGVAAGLLGLAPTGDGVKLNVAVGFSNACCAAALRPKSRAKSCSRS